MNDRARHALRRLALVLLAFGVVGAAPSGALSTAHAEDDPPAPVEATPTPTVGVIQGNRVNIRVGPRPGGRPVTQLDDGTVLLLVKTLPGWYEVHVPSGILAAVAGRYVEPVGADAVRVTARKLNLRVAPMQEGKAAPDPFRDQVQRGTVMPWVQREGDWYWVMVPESTRVYVSADYVREVGPLEKHMHLVERAREQRAKQLQLLAQQRAERAARRSGAKLRAAIGKAQQALYKFRVQRGIDRTPVVEVINGLEASIEACRESPVAVRKLAHAVRADLESELEMRVARKDAEVARLRGLEPPAERSAVPKIASVTQRGEIRWEAAPGWRNGGEWVLWVEDEPRYVLQLTTGLPHPLPDFKANAGRGARTIEGHQPGTRVFGLPVLQVRTISQ